MAVTIYQEPQLASPANNPLVFTFSSDETGQANFSYVVEVYVNGALHSTHKVFPESDIYSRFDCSEIMRSVVSATNPAVSTLNYDYAASWGSYWITVYESYGTPIAIEASATSSTRKAFNGSLRHIDFISWDYSLHDPSDTDGALFLTSFPRDQKYMVGMNDVSFLSLLNTVETSLDLNVELFDITGASIATDTYPIDNYFITTIDVSPSSLMANMSFTIGQLESCYYYEVSVDATLGYSTEKFKMYIDHSCERFTNQRLHWLNKFGTWDSFSFNLLSQESTDISSSQYKREKGAWKGSNYNYNRNQGEIITVAKWSVDKMVLNSDWMKESVQHWLVRELNESPKVNLYIESITDFEPCNVESTNVVLKKKYKDGLIQENVTISRTYSYNSQLN